MNRPRANNISTYEQSQLNVLSELCSEFNWSLDGRRDEGVREIESVTPPGHESAAENAAAVDRRSHRPQFPNPKLTGTAMHSHRLTQLCKYVHSALQLIARQAMGDCEKNCQNLYTKSLSLLIISKSETFSSFHGHFHPQHHKEGKEHNLAYACWIVHSKRPFS